MDQPIPSKPWLDRIEESEKAFRTYQEKCDTIDKLYASLDSMSKVIGDREFQIFWANLQVLMPVVYQRPPQPVVMPRHRDGNDVVRKASEMLERVLELDVEEDDLHDRLIEARDDLARCGRGVLWVIDNGHCLFVHRRDFVHDPARKWSEVGWVARRSYVTRDEGVERFGDNFRNAKFAEIKGKDDGNGNDYRTSEKKAQVWEIWSKTDNAVFWVTEGIDQVLEAADPLIRVKGFFPCPRPAYSTLEPETLKPVPDFVYYRDQIDEINELTARISGLTESLRLKGFYASGVSEVGEAIEAAFKQTDNQAILVPLSTAVALGGKIDDAIMWLPVREVAEVITQCVALRQQLIQDVYEITGLSDIMRGATDSQETATAQNLKAQFGSVRVRERQNEMVRIARDILRIKAEVYAETVPGQQLMVMSGMQLPTQRQVQQMLAQNPQAQPPTMLEQVDELLKSERMRPFLMEVESDSTIAPNEEAEKEARTEFVTMVGSFVQQSLPVVQGVPQAAPFMVEMLKFAAGAFRGGRELGSALDEFAEQIKAAAANPPPNPQAETAKMEAEARKEELQLKRDEQGIKMQTARMDAAHKAREMGLKVDEHMLSRAQAEFDALFKMEELKLEATQARPVAIGESNAG